MSLQQAQLKFAEFIRNYSADAEERDERDVKKYW